MEGKHRVRVYVPDNQPPPGFEPVAASLEDAYLLLMRLDPRAQERADLLGRIEDLGTRDVVQAGGEAAR